MCSYVFHFIVFKKEGEIRKKLNFRIESFRAYFTGEMNPCSVHLWLNILHDDKLFSRKGVVYKLYFLKKYTVQKIFFFCAVNA
jgi:hypothetical protein